MIEVDFEDKAWNEQRELLELAMTHAIREWWKFTGMPGRVEIQVQGVGVVKVEVKPESGARVS